MTAQPDTVALLADPQASQVLDELYADTIRTDPAVRRAAREAGAAGEGHPQFHAAMVEAYMPVTPDFGRLLYVLARTSRARNIVEFGTSFGVSTIFLAAALRDNGGGRLVTTERWPSKIERARANLVRAGLDHLVEFRTGDAMETLRSEQPASVDLLFLDGPKALYLDVLKLVEPRLVSGAAIASDNTDMDGAGGYLEHVRDRWNGYTSCALLTAALGAHHGHEIVLRN